MISPIEVAPSSAPELVKLARVTQTSRKQLVFKLTDDSGKPVDLKNEVENPPAPAPNFAPQKAATGLNVTVRLINRPNGSPIGGTVRWEVPGTILDQAEFPGFVSFQLTEVETRACGLFGCYIERQVSGPHMVDTWQVLVAVEPPAMFMLSGQGPLTIPEVRLALLDMDNQVGGNYAFANLLDNVEFQDVEIIFAMRRIIDLWNETPPPVFQATAGSFPYRYHWLEATCGQLLIMGAARYRRNRLAYQAGGIAIDDQSKADEYESTGQNKMKAFMEWMRNEKYRINMGLAWGIGL